MSLADYGPKPTGPTHPPKLPPPPPPPPPPPRYADFFGLWRACFVLTGRLAWLVIARKGAVR